MEAEGAEASVDLSRAAEIRYGEIPSLSANSNKNKNDSKNSRAHVACSKKRSPKRYRNNCC
jgi:hypothetical protein